MVKDNVSPVLRFELLEERVYGNLEKLHEAYKKDRVKARVLYLNDGHKTFYKNRLCLFERKDSFEICTIRTTWGISVSNKIYSSERKMKSIIWKGGKFWFANNSDNRKVFVQLTHNCIPVFLSEWPNSLYNRGSDNHKVYGYLINRFSWIRFVCENEVLHSVAFNTFVKNGLYNLNDSLKFLFDAPLPVIKTYIDSFKNTNGDIDSFNVAQFILAFKKLKKSLINIENLRVEMLRHPHFKDCVKMGNMLGKKINCSWSIKRLLSEHDIWSKEVANILVEFEELKELKIREIYLKFAEWSGLKILSTNFDLIQEGSIQQHCVGTYTNSVNNGYCAIFHIDGYTLELKVGGDYSVEQYRGKLFINQFNGFRNSNAPKELYNKVEAIINEYNEKFLSGENKKSSLLGSTVYDDMGIFDDL